MRILVDNIQTEKVKLQKEVELFESNHLNLSNETSQLMDYWQDPFSISLNNRLLESKPKELSFIKVLYELISFYDYLVEKYQVVGKKVEYNINNRELIFQKLNICINKLEVIINKYKNIISNIDARYLVLLKEHEEFFGSSLNKLKNLRELLKEKLNYIEEVESNVKIRLSKISVNKIDDILLEKIN